MLNTGPLNIRTAGTLMLNFSRDAFLQDNRSLKDQNDELNGQIINLSIQGAKNLMSASFSDSLAAEINSVSRTEARLKTILILIVIV